MVSTWLSIRVDLVSGPGGDLWPRPGRIFGAARSYFFIQLAVSIDRAFARWDLGHGHLFTLADQTPVTPTDRWDGQLPEGVIDGRTTTLARLQPGEQFAYVFDLGDRWTHLCTVAEEWIDPLEELCHVPHRPEPYRGWGVIPDQHARGWDGDDGESAAPKPPRPVLSDLPPILPEWGNQRRRR